jgi:hypothetical protein
MATLLKLYRIIGFFLCMLTFGSSLTWALMTGQDPIEGALKAWASSLLFLVIYVLLCALSVALIQPGKKEPDDEALQLSSEKTSID